MPIKRKVAEHIAQIHNVFLGHRFHELETSWSSCGEPLGLRRIMDLSDCSIGKTMEGSNCSWKRATTIWERERLI
jgi:hypothetical protein